MKKKKKNAQGKEKKAKEKRKTITSVVLKCLDKNPEANVQTISDTIVANGLKSKFNKAHLAWYKYQIRKGKLHLPSGRELPPKKKKEKKAKKNKKNKKSKKSKK